MAQSGKRNRMMNRSRVLRTVWRQPLISRIEVARQLGLDKSTISSLVGDLLTAGVLHEVAEGDSSRQGGRKPVLLRIDARYGNVLGLELQPDYYRAVLCDLNGGVLGSVSEEVAREDRPFHGYVLDIVARVNRALALAERPLIGIGMAMGGLVDCVHGKINGSIPMEIEDPYDFAAGVGSRFDVPVYAENDANACAWGELTFHRSAGITDFLYILIQIRRSGYGSHLYGGVGVGVGIVLDGTLYAGRESTAGEFRSVFWDGHSRGQFTLTDEEAARVSTDPEIRHRLFVEIARNMALIVNVLNLPHVFFGGDVMPYAQEFREALRAEIRRSWPYEREPAVTVNSSTMGENAVAYGAAGMLLDRMFTDQIFPIGHVRDHHGHAEMLRTLSEAMVQLGGRTESPHPPN